MKSRREFLKTAALAAAGGLILPGFLSSCGDGSPKPKQGLGLKSESAEDGKTSDKVMGLQLYSLRDMVKDEGIEAVLNTVAQMGWKRLEAAGYNDGKMYGLEPSDFKKMVEDLGMKLTSSHTGIPYSEDKKDEIADWWKKAIETHGKLDVKYLIQAWIPVNDQTSRDEVKMYCDHFNTLGLNTAASGIKFGYHNHDFEFKKKFDDQTMFDFMLANTSKDHVTFQLDVYWCMKGGYDPVEYMKNYSSQIKVLHIKDEMEIGKSGELDFKTIFEQARENNIKDWYVEVERYSNDNPVESVQESYDFLTNADFV